MTNYTIIAYRPDAVDTCKGCVMGRTGSDFETGFFKEILEAATFAVGFENRPGEDSLSYASWETMLLVDGLGENEWWEDKDWREVEQDPFDEFRSLRSEALRADAERRAQEKKRQEAAEADKRRRQAAAAARVREEAERVQLRELKEKYPDEA
ncbi:hypothetical protein G6L37_05125 [Agrobacterium rubi]|nr:hypothetical protein [Agrobacterium rubi]NTF24738.1 hypothetical protein [Agrobacterium rubi]